MNEIIFKRFIIIKKQVCPACIGITSYHQCINYKNDIDYYFNAIVFCYINLQITASEYRNNYLKWRKLKLSFSKEY